MPIGKYPREITYNPEFRGQKAELGGRWFQQGKRLNRVEVSERVLPADLNAGHTITSPGFQLSVCRANAGIIRIFPAAVGAFFIRCGKWSNARSQVRHPTSFRSCGEAGSKVNLKCDIQISWPGQSRRRGTLPVIRQPYDPSVWAAAEEKLRCKKIKRLQQSAAALGFKPSSIPTTWSPGFLRGSIFTYLGVMPIVPSHVPTN